jgi:hypothetical protein
VSLLFSYCSKSCALIIPRPLVLGHLRLSPKKKESDKKKEGQRELMDGSLLIKEACEVRWSGEDAVTIRIVEEEDAATGKPIEYAVVADVVTAIGAFSARRASTDQMLSSVAPANIEGGWFWFKVEGKYEKCLSVSRVGAYAQKLLSKALVHGRCKQDATEWASRRSKIAQVYALAVSRKRKQRQRQEEEEEGEGFVRRQRAPPPSEDSSERLIPMEEEDAPPPRVASEDLFAIDEDDDEDYREDDEVELDFSQMERLNDIHSKRVQTAALMLNTLPAESQERIKVQVAMHNSNAVLQAIHPLVNPYKRRRVRFPDLPAVGRPVRVSERLVALNYDLDDVQAEDYQRIGLVAADLYRRGPLAGPWKVVAWAGNRQVERYYYTEETQHFIDQAIEQVLGDQ